MEYGYSSGDYGDEFRFSGSASSSYDTYTREGREFVSTSAVSMQPMALMQGQALQAMPVMASREFDREQFEQEPYRYVDEYNRAVYPEAPAQQYLSQGQQAFEDRPGYEDNEYRERERERDRSYRRSRDSRDRRRDGRRYDSRDRDRDRERDRDRGDSWRSRDRRERDSPRNDDGNPDLGQNEESNDSRDSRDSRESRDKRDHRDRDRDRDRDREDRAGEKWMTETPTNTILIRGLSFDVDEKDIRAELMLFGCPIKDVRLMRRSSGASRGFAFVEFQNVTDAQRWMDQNQGKMQLLNQHSVSLHYSTPRVGPEKSQQTKMDWVCSKCNVHNFRRRDFCFKCNLSREESERTKDGDGFDQVGTNPCNTLIFRGLDALTTEETLCQAIGQHTSIAIKNVRVIRDQLTNTSRGYAFAELGSVAEGTQLLEFLTALNPPLEVDGKQILVSYARNTFNTVMTQIHNFYSQQGDYYGGYYGQGDYSQGFDAYYQGGQYYAEGQAYDYSQYYAAGTTTTTEKQNTTNAAAAVAQAAIQQAQAAKQYQKHTAPTSTASAAVESSTEYPKYPPPDVSTYQYDESSGYYYDPLTGLYYDANSQYYYNAQSQQYMYWDAEKSSYLPAPNQSQAEGSVSATSGQSNNQETGDTNKDGSKKDPNNKDKKEKVKVAKRIAKDMEKWAKAMNTKKEAMKDGMRFVLAAQKAERESATADAGFAIVEKLKSGSLDDKKLMPPPPLAGGRNETSPSKPASASPALVASYGGDSDDEEDEEGVVDESKLVDWTKLACLLCKRQFQSNEILTKHMQFSDLHKQNLENFRSKQASGEKKEYRDRAKERREKYGKTEPPVPKKQHVEAPVVTELPPRPAMDSGNIGNKLLQKMGWSAGQGLGKANQGRTAPVETQRRVTNAGLGVKGANVAAAAGDTYKDAVKKTMFARYHDLE